MQRFSIIAAMVAAGTAFAEESEESVDVALNVGVGAGVRTDGVTGGAAELAFGIALPVAAQTVIGPDFRAEIGKGVERRTLVSNLYGGFGIGTVPVATRIFVRGSFGVVRLAFHNRDTHETEERDWGGAAVVEAGAKLFEFDGRRDLGGAVTLAIFALPAYYGERGLNASFGASLGFMHW